MTTPVLDWTSVSQALGIDPIHGTCTRHPTCCLLHSTSIDAVTAPVTIDTTQTPASSSSSPSTTGRRIHTCRICESEFLSLVSATMTTGTATGNHDYPTNSVSSSLSSSAQRWWATRQQRKSMAPSIQAIQSIHAMPEWKEFTKQLHRNSENGDDHKDVDGGNENADNDEIQTSALDPTMMAIQPTLSAAHGAAASTTMTMVLQEMDPMDLLQQALLRSQQLQDWEVIQHDLTLAALKEQLSTLQKERDEQAALIETLQSKIERQQQTIAKELKMIKTIAKKRANSRTKISSGGGGAGFTSDLITSNTLNPNRDQNVAARSASPMAEAPPKLPDRKVSSNIASDQTQSHDEHQQQQMGGESWKDLSRPLMGSEHEPPPPPPPLITSPPTAAPVMPVRQTTKEPMVMAGPPLLLPQQSQQQTQQRHSAMESPPVKPVRLVSHDKLSPEPNQPLSNSSHHRRRPPSPMRAASHHSSGGGPRKGRRGVPLSPNTWTLTNDGIATTNNTNAHDNPSPVAAIKSATTTVAKGRTVDDCNHVISSDSVKSINDTDTHPEHNSKSADQEGDDDSSSSSSSEVESSSTGSSGSSSATSSSSSAASSVGVRSDQPIVEFTPPPPFDRKSLQTRATTSGTNHDKAYGNRPSSFVSYMDERSSRGSSSNNNGNLERRMSKEIAFVPTPLESQEGGSLPSIPPPFVSSNARSFDQGGGSKDISFNGQTSRNQSPVPLTSRPSITEHQFNESQQLLKDASLALNSSAMPTPASVKLRKSLLKKGSTSDLSPVSRRQATGSPIPGRPTELSPVPRAGRRSVALVKGLQSPSVHSPQQREQPQAHQKEPWIGSASSAHQYTHPHEKQPRRGSTSNVHQYTPPHEKQPRRGSTSNVHQLTPPHDKQPRRGSTSSTYMFSTNRTPASPLQAISPLQNMTPLERHLAISNSPYHSRNSSFQSQPKTNQGKASVLSQLDPPPLSSEMTPSFRSIPSHPQHADDDNDEDGFDDELGDHFDDGAAPLKLGDYFKLGDYLEVQRSVNLSPVSALTTGSYLKEQALAAQADNEIQPRKSLQNAIFAKKLPLEDDFDSGEEESESLAPRAGRPVPQNKDVPKNADDFESDLVAARPTPTETEAAPSAVQRKLSKSEKSPAVKRKISKKKEALSELISASEGVVKKSKQKAHKEQLSAEPVQARRRPSRRLTKPVRQVNGETVSDKYGDEGLYTGTVTVDSELPHGYGEMKYFNERQYAGDWKSGRWHGIGRWSNPNGDVYEGTFDYDARHGAGVYTWKNGNCYKGEFYEDKRQGKGTFHFANGNEYIGEFINGVFEGSGKYLFEGGEYNGSWVSGRYHGSGTLIFHDGTSYKGEFADGVAHGKGEETTADGNVRRGIWDQGRPQK